MLRQGEPWCQRANRYFLSLQEIRNLRVGCAKEHKFSQNLRNKELNDHLKIFYRILENRIS